MRKLGDCYRHQGRIFLVGGSSLILAATKTSTLDIDLKIEVPAEFHSEFVQCLRKLSRQLSLPVEEAAPDQFIPLPRGYQERHRFIGRFGNLDVFHFDFYSIALSKLYRGNEKDYEDAVQMIKQGLIEQTRLREYFYEVLPQLEMFRINSDPVAFRRQFEKFEQLLLE